MMMKVRSLPVWIFMLVTISSCYLSDEEPEDQKIWGYKQPGDVFLDEGLLREIDQAVKSDRFENIKGLLMVKDQSIVFENYYEEPQRNDLFPLLRSTALLGSTAVGLLLKNRLVDSVETPLYVLLPEYDYIFDSAPQKREITLLDILQQRSGLIWDEMNLAYDSPSNYLNQMKASDDWVEFVLSQNQEAPPGIRTVYNSGTAMIISRIVENLTGIPAGDYLNRELFDKMNILNRRWERAEGASTDLSTGLSLNIIDLTKLGYLYLNEGFWQGTELLSPAYVRLSKSRGNEVSQIANYAANWHYFSSNLNFTESWRENDVFYFSNEQGTHLYIVPHLNAVVTIHAENLFYGFSNPSLLLFLNVMNSSSR